MEDAPLVEHMAAVELHPYFPLALLMADAALGGQIVSLKAPHLLDSQPAFLVLDMGTGNLDDVILLLDGFVIGLVVL